MRPTPTLGAITSGPALLCIIGLLITGVLLAYKVKGAIIIGIVASTIIGIPMGVTVIPESFAISQVTLAPHLL